MGDRGDALVRRSPSVSSLCLHQERLEDRQLVLHDRAIDSVISTVSIVLDLYAHVIPSMKGEAVAARCSAWSAFPV